MRQLKVSFDTRQYSVYYITDPGEAQKIAQKIAESPIKNFGIDIETAKLSKFKEHKKAGLCPHLSNPRLLQIFDGDKTVYVFDLFKVNVLSVMPVIRMKNFVAHNGIFEIKHFTYNKIPDLQIGCSMIQAMMIDTAEHSPYEPKEEEEDEVDNEPSVKRWKGFSLEACIAREFNLRVEKSFQTSDWSEPNLSSGQIAYAALDSILTYRLAEKYAKKVSEYKMTKAYLLLKDFQHVVAHMELNGMYLDKSRHDKLIRGWEREQTLYTTECNKYFKEVNLNSPKQMEKWAHGRFKKEIIDLWPRSQKTGALSFNQKAIVYFSHLKEIKALCDYKRVSKLISTYGTSLQEALHPRTGRLHCEYSLGETRTGRLSSRNPNLQNLPRDKEIRNIFRAPEGTSLVVADFGQIEMRVAGELGQDNVIRKACAKDIDLHTLMARQITGKKEVTQEERRLAKALNFGALFGLGPAKFAKYCKSDYNVDVTEERAKELLKMHALTYSGYSRWRKEVQDKAKITGFARTPMGKMRKLLENETYTKAPNTGVQGGAFEVMALTMLLIPRDTRHWKILNSVHDEVILEVPSGNEQEAVRMLESSMVDGMLQLFPKAPITAKFAKAHVAQAWGDAKE